MGGSEKLHLLHRHLCSSGPAAGKRSGEPGRELLVPPPDSGAFLPCLCLLALAPFAAGFFDPFRLGISVLKHRRWDLPERKRAED